jgi:membrane-associated PAP2 superfamily phosphatase
VLAAVVNVVIWFVATLIGTVTVPVTAVIVSSIIGVAVGGVVYALIGRFIKRPITVFTIIAIAFLVISLLSPVSAMQSPPPGMEKFNVPTVIATLLMHVVTGALAIWSYTKRARVT